MAATSRQNPYYYISQAAITISPNAVDGDPSYVAVSVVTGTLIMLSVKHYAQFVEGLDYTADQQNPTWRLSGYSTKLQDEYADKQVYIYARLVADASNGLLVFSDEDYTSTISADGNSSDPGIAKKDNYIYVKLGYLTVPYSGKRDVNWDSGCLLTQYAEDTKEEFGELFKLVNNFIVPMKFFSELTVNGLLTALDGLKVNGTWLFNNYEITDLKAYADYEKQLGTVISATDDFDKYLPSMKLIFSYINNHLRNDIDSIAKGKITFAGGINLDDQDITGVDVGSDVPNGGLTEAKDTSIPTTAAMVKHVQKHGDANFLSKVNDDTAKGVITFDKGLKVGNFTPGVADGTGGAMEVSESGVVTTTTDYLNVRRKARFNDVEILTTHHIGGAQMSSAASCKIDFVETVKNGDTVTGYRCYFRKNDADGRVITNDWVVGDQAYCNTFNLSEQADGMTGNHFFWRFVNYKGVKKSIVTGDDGVQYNGNEYHYIILSGPRCAEGSDDPQAGDEVVLLGHQPQSGETEADYAGRQSAVYQVASGEDGRPYYRQYVGINSFSLDGCLEQQFMPGDNIFSGQVNIKGGSGWENFSGLSDILAEKKGKFVSENEPTLDIDSYETGLSYIGYEWYNPQTKVTKIWKTNPFNSSKFGWFEVEDYRIDSIDESIASIVGEISGLQNQLDGVVESFFDDYTPTLDNEPAATWIEDKKEDEHVGDTFTNTSVSGDDAGKSWRWLKLSDGTYGWQIIVDTDALKALEQIKTLEGTIDGKCSTYLSKPRSYRKGDLWILENDTIYSGYKTGDILTSNANRTFYRKADWSKLIRYTDDSALESYKSLVEQQQQQLKKQVDGKVEFWYQTSDPISDFNATGYYEMLAHVGDIWYNPDDNISYVLQKGDADSFVWMKIEDKDALQAIKDAEEIKLFLEGEYKDDLQKIKDQIDKKAQTWYQTSDPSSKWSTEEYDSHIGDLWYDPTNGESKRWNGEAWATQDVPDSVFDAIDGKANIFVGDELPKPPYNIGDFWVNATYSDTLDDGTKVEYDNDILRCANSKQSGVGDIKDWVYASNYINEKKAENIVQDAIKDINIDSFRYDNLIEATEGDATLKGGLFLTNTLVVGNFPENTDFNNSAVLDNVRAGINGLYENEDGDKSIAVWGGGTYAQARKLVKFYNDNPKAIPTEEELRKMAKFVITHGGKAILQDAIVSGTIHATNGSFINGTFKNVVINGAYNRLVQTIDNSNYNNFLYNDGDDNEYYALLLQWGDVIHLNLTSEDLETAPQIMLPTSIPFYNDIDKEVQYSNVLGYRTNDAGDIVPMDIDDLRSLVGRKIVIHADNVRSDLRLNVGNIYMETSIPDDGQEFYLTSPEHGNWIQSPTDGQIYIGKGETFIMECLLAKRKFLIDPNDDTKGWTIAEMICWSVQKITMSSKQQAGDIIAFKVNCDGYPSTWRAEKGMRWSDFVNSSYSNEQFSIDSANNVCFNDGNPWDLYHDFDEENETFTNNVKAYEAINEGDNYYAG